MRWCDARSAHRPRTDGRAVRASNLLGRAGRLPWSAQSPDLRGERGRRGVRDELPRSGVDMELLGQLPQGRTGLVGSDQLVDLGVGQKSLSHFK